MAATHGWTALSLDAMGTTETVGSARHATQPVRAAMQEMAEQGRPGATGYSSPSGRTRTVRRCARPRPVWRRSCSTGAVEVVYRDFIGPAIREAQHETKTYDVARAEQPLCSRWCKLRYHDEPFSTFDGMNALCDAVRSCRRVSVTVIHLNPYLQAQILDFFTGAAVELWIMDSNTVSIVPRSAKCQTTLERIATTILGVFGEARVSKAGVGSA